MYQKAWEVLLVDDEPDVLNISKLAMSDFEVYGVPLKLHTADSKAEAIHLIDTKADLLPALAVAFIDVVMETDTAGLDLCRYIREDRGNKLTQIFVRTGQPGVAPEREVIDRYDINGYFTKAEATEDKLYSLVKSGIRQHYWSEFSMGFFGYVRSLLATGGSREKIAAMTQGFLDAAFEEQGGDAVESYTNVNFAYIADDTVVGTAGWDRQSALRVRDELNRHEGTPLNSEGDKYVIDENNRLLIRVASQDDRAEAFALATPNFDPPDFVITFLLGNLEALAIMWSQAK